MKTRLTDWERGAVMASCVPDLLAAFAVPVRAMHIMEAFCPRPMPSGGVSFAFPSWCGALLPFASW